LRFTRRAEWLLLAGVSNAKVRSNGTLPCLVLIDRTVQFLGEVLSDQLFTGLPFQKDSDYVEIDPQNLTLEVHESGKNQTILTVPSFNAVAGTIYTVVVAGNGTEGQPLTAIQFQDQFKPLDSAHDVHKPSTGL
jgi:hypothetical protein